MTGSLQGAMLELVDDHARTDLVNSSWKRPE